MPTMFTATTMTGGSSAMRQAPFQIPNAIMTPARGVRKVNAL